MLLFSGDNGIRRERPDRREGKKHAGGMFFSSGENPGAADGIPEGCWPLYHMFAEGYFKVYSFFFVNLGFEPSECNSPGFTKDIFTGEKCTVYPLPIYWDSLQCSSIYHGSRCRFESHDRRNLSAKQKKPLSLK